MVATLTETMNMGVCAKPLFFKSAMPTILIKDVLTQFFVICGKRYIFVSTKNDAKHRDIITNLKKTIWLKKEKHFRKILKGY